MWLLKQATNRFQTNELIEIKKYPNVKEAKILGLKTHNYFLLSFLSETLPEVLSLSRDILKCGILVKTVKARVINITAQKVKIVRSWL